MPQFEPPFHYVDRRFDPRDLPSAKAVLRYYRPNPTGITVFVLDDGTVTQDRRYFTQSTERVVRTYRGGYVYDISNAEAAVLAAAGYNVTPHEQSWGRAEWGTQPWGHQ